MKICDYFRKRLNKERKHDISNSMEFSNLSYNENADISSYRDALDYAMQDDNVKNIALIGSNGAGKTSVIKTYFKNNPGRKVIYTSLAHFENTSIENCIRDDDRTRDVLSNKLLNQIIHQVNEKQISATRLPIKREFGLKWICIAVLSILIIGTIEYFNILRNELDYSSIIDTWDNSKLLFFIGIVIFALIIVTVCHIFKRIWESFAIQKINIKGNEIVLYNDEKDSPFDKYLSEVLYIFDKTKLDAVVIEDIDRFSDITIFERLREINALINSKRNKQNPIKFIYLLRDGMLQPRDRTKFFDFIIPIVAYSDSSNSYGRFKTIFNNNYAIDDNFLFEASQYVDDMRLVKNIANEFVIIKKVLCRTPINDTKLLAMTIYKNLFPEDYDALQFDTGYIHILFLEKGKYIEDITNNSESELNNARSEIKEIEDEYLTSVAELDILRRHYLYDQPWSDSEYKRRKEAVQKKNNGEIDRIRNRIDTLQEEIDCAKSRSMSQLLLDNQSIFDTVGEKTGFDKHKEKNEDTNYKLIQKVLKSHYFPALKYLLMNGYIDETYPDYMTYFVEGDMSKSDKEYFMKVLSRGEPDYEKNIDYPEQIVYRLREEYFDTMSALNYYILDYLYSINNQSAKNKVLSTLKRNRCYSFVVGYHKRTEHKSEFIKDLFEIWDSLFEEIAAEEVYKEEFIRKSLQELLCLGDIATWNRIKDKDSLVEYIEKDDEFLNIQNEYEGVFIKALENIDIHFECLAYSKSNVSVYSIVCEEGLYIINKNNILDVMCSSYKVDEYEAKHKNYTVIQTVIDCLKRKIADEMNDYVKVEISISDGKIEDNQEDACKIINDTSIEKNIKEEYIDAYCGKIKDISRIEDNSLWALMARNGIVYKSIKNIVALFNETGGIDRYLIDFINSNDTVDFEGIEALNNDTIKNFSTQYAIKSDENERDYISILEKCKASINSIADVGQLNTDKKKLLLLHGIISPEIEIETLIGIICEIDREDFDCIISTLRHSEISECLLKHKSSKLELTDEMDDLLKEIKKKGWISGYKKGHKYYNIKK